MIKGEYAYLKDLALTYLCPEHNGCLSVAWHATEDSYVLRCGAAHYPEEIVKQRTLTELWKSNELPTGPIADNIERREKKKAMTQAKKTVVEELALVPHADLGSGELLVPEVVKALMGFAREYNLDIFRGHVVMMYGKPYITLDGYLYTVARSGRPHNIKSRPLNDKERKTFKVGDDDHAWICEIELLAPQGSFNGFGIVTKEEMVAKSTKNPEQLRSPVVAAHPWQLAQKRAEWQALRRAFPIAEVEEVKSEVEKQYQDTKNLENT